MPYWIAATKQGELELDEESWRCEGCGAAFRFDDKLPDFSFPKEVCGEGCLPAESVREGAGEICEALSVCSLEDLAGLGIAIVRRANEVRLTWSGDVVFDVSYDHNGSEFFVYKVRVFEKREWIRSLIELRDR